MNSTLINDIEELRGMVLGCWCVDHTLDEALSEPRCHGDILVKILNNI